MKYFVLFSANKNFLNLKTSTVNDAKKMLFLKCLSDVTKIQMIKTFFCGKNLFLNENF